jgi:hypothetical protein
MFGKLACFVVGAGIGILVAGAIGHYILASGYNYAEMDWNEDGETSLSEMLHGAADVGVENVDVNGRSCKRFFEYKDGRTVKALCDGKAVSLDPTRPDWAQ